MSGLAAVSCRLPQELCDNIIDHLHGEQTALKQCSLVCRSWLPSSTLHLFHRLQWPPCSHLENVHCPERYHRGPIASGIEDVLRASSRFGSAVEELVITVHSTSCRKFALQGGAVTRDTSAVLRTLGLLPRLVKLSVIRYPLQTDPPATEFLQAFNLEELSIQSDAWLPSYDAPPPAIDVQQLLSFTACFRNVSKLIVDGKFGEAATFIEVASVAQPLSLHVESLSVPTQNSDILGALDAITDFASVRSLQLQYLPDTPVAAAAKMTRLESLEYHLSEYFPADVLAGCPPLRRLTFVGHFIVHTHERWDEGGWMTSWRELVRDLQLFDASALRELVVVFTVYEAERDDQTPALEWQVEGAMHAQEEHWQALEDVVQRRCPVLQRVEFRLCESDPANHPCPSRHVFRLFEKTAREQILSRRMQGLLNVVIVD